MVQTSGGQQRLRQLDLDLIETTLDRSDRHAEDERDLLVGGMTAEVAQHRRDPQRLRQRAERGPDPIPERELIDPLLEGWLGRSEILAAGQIIQREYCRCRAPRFPAHVPGDGTQPRTDSLRIVERIQPVEGDQESVVYRVLGLGAVSQHLERNGMQGWPVPFEQRTEARNIAGPGRVDEVCITQGIRIHHRLSHAMRHGLHVSLLTGCMNGTECSISRAEPGTEAGRRITRGTSMVRRLLSRPDMCLGPPIIRSGPELARDHSPPVTSKCCSTSPLGLPHRPFLWEYGRELT
ncbi:MAG: hypothetical protein AVDCRST_MAG93-1443 [uncultured Chloroflexia bacterium]|uniref:Uncharacterized protein n=1 Tax=uncultured Chloroflexia bacterium TaxID=1672391 RepID=A0A6J4I8E7_9CHLR|nr:MAG: hypothetical protein AVDCRST_MAG93-1443 [uncultured Chloroflexia bacterium]